MACASNTAQLHAALMVRSQQQRAEEQPRLKPHGHDEGAAQFLWETFRAGLRGKA